MNTENDLAGNSVSISRWSGFDQLRLTDDTSAVDVTIGSADRWDRAHLRRLRQSADLPGLVPVIDSDFASDGKPFAVTPVVDAPTLADRIPPTGSEWETCAAITEAAARATHEAHIRGLFHGSLSPDQIHVIDEDVAVSGIGLGLGGNFGGEYAAWVAPEVLDGSDATERSDVYSLGKILEASLGGSLENVPRSVRRLIMWSSSDTPEARPPSALEFASILAEALGDDRPTFNPAFIPTAELNDLASTASESVAAYEPSGASSAAAIGTAAVTGGAAAVAVSALGDDVETEGADTAATDEPDIEPAAADASPDADEIGPVETEVQADGGDVTVAPADTDEIPADDLAATTTELEAPPADEPGNGGVLEPAPTFDSRQYGEEMQQEAGDEGYAVPAAAQTIDLDETYETERRSSRAGILIGAILAVGLGLIAFGLLNSGDDETTDADAAAGGAETGETGAIADEPADGEADADAVAETEPQTATTAAAETGTTAVEPETATTAAAETNAIDGDEDAAATTAAAETNAIDDDEAAAAETTTAADDSAEAGTDTDTDATAEADATAETDATAGTDTDATAETDTDATAETDTDATAETDTDATAETDATADADGASSTEVELAAPGTLVEGPISADDARLQVLHGIPGVTADVYVNGEALAPAFDAGMIAGPADLPPGAYDIAIYPAIDQAPAAAADRSDEPLINQTVNVGAEPSTLVAHLDADGNPTISAFAEQLSDLEPATGRIELRHLAAAPAVTATIDGEELGAALEPGRSTSLTLDAGEHQLATFTEDGTPVQSATIELADGELASVSLIGSAADESIEAVVQRYTGLATAPVADDGVPAGDSNLLGTDEDPTGLYVVAALTALMAAAGGVMMLRRSRRVL